MQGLIMANIGGSLSNITITLLTNLIKQVKQEDNAVEIIQIASNLVSDAQQINSNEIKVAVTEELKKELATKDFVRAEIAELRTELKTEIAETKYTLIKWVIGVGVASGLATIGSTWAMFSFLVEHIK